MQAFTSPRYYVPLPPGHVFPMRKFPDSTAKLLADGTLAGVADPGRIADADLLRVHTPAYVESIRTGRFNEVTARRLGLPPSDALSVRSHCAVAGTLAAARAAMVDGLAANLAGGTHHAFADRGEGFCVFNDVAVAVRTLQAEEPLLHAMVVDLDAHQGNGTHAIFRGDPFVYTYSVHVGRNYPSVKEPGTQDVELPRWVTGPEYLQRLHDTLPAAVERFEPDVVFYIAGADCHADDRFGQMTAQHGRHARAGRGARSPCAAGGASRPWCCTAAGTTRVEGMTTELHCQTVRAAARRFAAERAVASGG